jgi:hypothetical protein
VLVGAFPVLFMLMSVYKLIFLITLTNYNLKLLYEIISTIFKDHQVKIEEIIKIHLISVKTLKEPHEKLQAARKIFNIIFESVALINSSHGMTILLILITLVVGLAVSGYRAL